MKSLKIIFFVFLLLLLKITFGAEELNNNEADINNLEISSLEVIDTRNIDLKFNLELNTESDVNLNIVNINDDLEDIDVENYNIEGNILKVFLNSDLKLENEYSIIVLTVEGKNGETIKTGIDGIKDFIVDINTRKYTEEKEDIDLNSAGTGTTDKEEVKQEEVKQEEVKQNKVLGGKNLINKEKVVEKIAKDKKDLPTTGPAETFLFLLFSLLAGGLFLNLRRKTNA